MADDGLDPSCDGLAVVSSVISSARESCVERMRGAAATGTSARSSRMVVGGRESVPASFLESYVSAIACGGR